jgi:hypothetical protein
MIRKGKPVSCSNSGTRRVNLITNPVTSHEWGKDWEVLTTSGTWPWSFLKQIFHNGQPSHGGDHRRTPNRYSRASVPIYYIFYNILTYAACMAVGCILWKSHIVGLMLQSHSSKHGVPVAHVYYSNGACTSMSKTWFPMTKYVRDSIQM